MDTNKENKMENKTWHYSKFNSTRYHNVDIRQPLMLDKFGFFNTSIADPDCKSGMTLLDFHDYFKTFLNTFYYRFYVSQDDRRHDG